MTTPIGAIAPISHLIPPVTPTSGGASAISGVGLGSVTGSNTAINTVFDTALSDAVGDNPAVRIAKGTPVDQGLDLSGSLAKGFDAVQASQHEADTIAVQAASGQIVDPAQLTIAMTKAQLMTQVAAAVQSKAVTAFNTIMSMQA